jgi:hypothetical protein
MSGGSADAREHAREGYERGWTGVGSPSVAEQSVCGKCGGTSANVDFDEGVVTCRDCGEQRSVGPGDDMHAELLADTVALLRTLTDEINAPLLEKGLGSERQETPQAAALQLRRREIEDGAIRALFEMVKEGAEWGEVGDVVAKSEAWWVYVALVTRAHETLPDQIEGA